MTSAPESPNTQVARLRKLATTATEKFLSAELPADDFGDEKTLRQLTYQRTPVTAGEVESMDIEECYFQATGLAGIVMSRGVISDTLFDQCDFANARFDSTSLLKSHITNGRLTGTSWSAGLIRDVVFDACRAQLARFRHMKIRGTTFNDCDFTQADFQWAELRDVVFHKCDLTAAQFANAIMCKVRFQDCDMTNLSGVAGLKGASVRGGDLVTLAASLAQEAGISIEN